MRIAFTALLCLLIKAGDSAEYTGIASDRFSIQDTADRNPLKIQLRAEPFSLSQVRLTAGPFKDALERNHKYLLTLEPERLLHNFRINAGLPSRATPLGGWEKPDVELRGHFTGHYLSACALMFTATGDTALRLRAQKIVAGLAECQKALGTSGYLSAFPEELIDRVESGKRVWAPYYTLHKIYAGLLDTYLNCGIDQALEVLTKAIGWVKSRTDKLDDLRMQTMLRVEFGGMAEVLSNLSAVTGNPEYLSLARRFDKKTFLDPLTKGRDELKGLHANTHIPQAIAAAREFELTGENSYRDAAIFFWNQIVNARSYCTGGTSNYEYWRKDPGKLAGELSVETHENCCTYNMLRLSRRLFSWSADPRIADYYERALLNGILPTQHPEEGGGLMYYVPLKSGLFKMFGVPDSSYWCCNGTGIESFSTLGNSIYFHEGPNLYVNLFIPSELRWDERGLRLRQETDFPERETTTLHLALARPTEMTIFIRIPSWVTRPAVVMINGRRLTAGTSPGMYSALKRKWENGDRVEVTLPMDLHLSRLPDDPTTAAVMYGPVVLAGALGSEGMTEKMKNGFGFPDVNRMFTDGAAIEAPALVPQSTKLTKWIVPVSGRPLTFRTVKAGRPKDVTLLPFYRMFGQRYAIYWDLFTPAEWKEHESSRSVLPPGVIDHVQIGDAKSEKEHNFQAYHFSQGNTRGRGWVKSPQWFRHDLNVRPERPMTLSCTYSGDERDCIFDILIDGLLLATQTLDGQKPGEFLTISYPIPADLVKGKKRVAVMLRGKEGKTTAEVYDCSIEETPR